MIAAARKINAEMIDPFVAAARNAGCPIDQVYNFLKAGCILHPKQLLASAAARACDQPDGPRAVGFGGARAGGKAIDVETRLPTLSGLYKRMGDVQVGNYLLDENWRECRVTAVSEVMYDHDCYEVVFDDGTIIIADAGHLWLTDNESDRLLLSEGEPRTTLEIKRTLCTKGVPQHVVRSRRESWSIVDVRQVPSVPVKCVTVDSPNHLYLASESWIPTHNSHWMVAQIGVDDCQRVAGLKCLLLRRTAKAGKEGFADLRRRIFSSLPHNYRERDGSLVFPQNESQIIIGHFKDERDIDDYLGLEYDVIGVEEATTLSNSKLTNIESCCRTSKPNFRPRMYSTTNPGGLSHQQYKKKFILPYRSVKETSTRFVMSLAKDNPNINKEYESEVLAQYTGWQKRAWLDGDWDIESGQYFTNFNYDTHVAKRQGFELPTTWEVWCSLDHGLTHYTAVYLWAKDGDGNPYCLDEHAERGWLPSQHAGAIKSLLGRWEIPLTKLRSFVAGHDCFAKKAHDEEIGTLADDYRAEGIILTRANIDRINGAKELYRRLGTPPEDNATAAVVVRPTLTILDSCPRLIECIPSLQRDPKRPEDVLKVDCDPETGEGGDDFYDAARYGLMEVSLSSRNNTSGPSIAGPSRDFSLYKPR